MAMGLTCGVYKISAPSGHFYIGSSKNIGARWREHRRLMRLGEHVNPALGRAWLRYGELEFSVLVVCRPEDRVLYEQALIDALQPTYNASRIAGRVDHTPAVRAKIADANKRRVISDATRERMRAAKAGKPQTLEHRQKGAASRIGTTRSTETRAKMSAANRRRPVSDKTRAAFEKANRERVVSAETRAKMRAAHLRRHALAAIARAALPPG